MAGTIKIVRLYVRPIKTFELRIGDKDGNPANGSPIVYTRTYPPGVAFWVDGIEESSGMMRDADRQPAPNPPGWDQKGSRWFHKSNVEVLPIPNTDTTTTGKEIIIGFTKPVQDALVAVLVTLKDFIASWKKPL